MHQQSPHDAVSTSDGSTNKMIRILAVSDKLFAIGLTRQVSSLTVGIIEEVTREILCNVEFVGLKLWTKLSGVFCQR